MPAPFAMSLTVPVLLVCRGCVWFSCCRFKKLGIRGISIMFAAGDDGTGGNCSDSGRFTPDFPSGSPWVTAVVRHAGLGCVMWAYCVRVMAPR